MFKITKNKNEFKSIKIEGNKIVVSWDYSEIFENETKFEHGKEVQTENKVPTGLASWYEYVLPKSNSISEIEIVSILKSVIDEDVTSKIVSGYKWKGYSVNLTTENQSNYKAAYDLAVQTNGETLPYKVKLKKRSTNVIYEFTSLDEFGSFYKGIVNHINKCLENGWALKENLKSEDYII